MWIHTFFHISDLLEQPPWDVSSWVVDVQVLFYPSDITVSALVPCMVYGVPGHVLLVIATTLQCSLFFINVNIFYSYI